MEIFTEWYNAITEFLYRLFISFIDAFKDLFFWSVESLLQAVHFALSGVFSLFDQIDVSQYMSAVPSTVAWVFIQIGLPNALLIISSALGIRLILQLIPFVRLGS